MPTCKCCGKETTNTIYHTCQKGKGCEVVQELKKEIEELKKGKDNE